MIDSDAYGKSADLLAARALAGVQAKRPEVAVESLSGLTRVVSRRPRTI
jgi:hypothetical protein